MTLLTFGGILAIGLIVGIISGLVGIGGGAFLIPALVFFFGMSQIKAQGTSLATLLLPIGIFAFVTYYKAGHVDIKMALVLALGFAIGGWFGGTWAQHLPDVVLKRGFAALLALLAVKMTSAGDWQRGFRSRSSVFTLFTRLHVLFFLNGPGGGGTPAHNRGISEEVVVHRVTLAPAIS